MLNAIKLNDMAKRNVNEFLYYVDFKVTYSGLNPTFTYQRVVDSKGIEDLQKLFKRANSEDFYKLEFIVRLNNQVFSNRFKFREILDRRAIFWMVTSSSYTSVGPLLLFFEILTPTFANSRIYNPTIIQVQSTMQTTNTQDMQLIDLQSDMGGGITAFTLGDYAVTIQQKGGQRNGQKKYTRGECDDELRQQGLEHRYIFTSSRYSRYSQCFPECTDEHITGGGLYDGVKTRRSKSNCKIYRKSDGQQNSLFNKRKQSIGLEAIFTVKQLTSRKEVVA